MFFSKDFVTSLLFLCLENGVITDQLTVALLSRALSNGPTVYLKINMVCYV